MDSKLLLSSHRSHPPPILVPLLLSSPSSHLPFPRKSLFFGTNLVLHETASRRSSLQTRHPSRIAAVVKRRKEMPFDTVIERDKKLKLVMKIRNILVSQPDRIMSLRELGRFRRDLGLTRKRRFIALLKRFPGVFEIVEEGVYSLKFRLTPEAERVYLEELRVKNEMESLLVVKLRKLLMMSLDKRILIEKISHLKHDLGLPNEFRSTICERYPQYFIVVRTEHGPALELTHWDPNLALTTAELTEEENRIRKMEERNFIIDRPPKFKRVKLPRGLNLSRGEMRRITQFNEMPYISPYSDFSELKPGTAEKEKHACAVIHEILSLTLEKRTLVDHLTHFREEFRFSQQLRGMLIRHPDMFYVSLKGDRDSVFLREAYRDSHLVEKDRLLLLKEKFRALVAVPRFSAGRGMMKNNSAVENDEALQEGSEDEGDQEWSDGECSFLNELGSELDDLDDFDDEEDAGDDWSDEDDESPPNFDEGGDSIMVKRQKPHMSSGSRSKDDKDHVPAFPDGKPRERW